MISVFDLASIFLCISFIFLLFQCTSSQPLSTNSLKSNRNNIDVGFADLIHMQPASYSSSHELNSDENDSEEFSRLLSKILEEYDEHEHDKKNGPNTLAPFRRANFWKRANFWRKRANFW